MLFNLHPFTYFRAKAFLCWLAQHMPGQAELSDRSLEKRWGPIRIWLYRHVWAEGDPVFPGVPRPPVGAEDEICQISLGPLYFVFELTETPELDTEFTLWVTT